MKQCVLKCEYYTLLSSFFAVFRMQ